jgi:hypothetical protein
VELDIFDTTDPAGIAGVLSSLVAQAVGVRVQDCLWCQSSAAAVAGVPLVGLLQVQVTSSTEPAADPVVFSSPPPNGGFGGSRFVPLVDAGKWVAHNNGGIAVLAQVDFEQGISDAWSKVAEFVPKLLGFLVILVIGYLIAKAIGKIVGKVLERVGFDRAVERGGIKKALESSKFDASDILGKVVFYALFLIVLQMAFGVFGANPVSDLLTGVVAYLPKVIAAILIIVIATAIAAAVRELLDASLGGLSYGRLLANGAGVAIITVGVFAALDQLQIAPAIVTGLFYALLAIVAGSAIIAIGGGGIAPMRTRWEQMLARYDDEKPKVREEMDGAKERIEQRARERKAQADPQAGVQVRRPRS